MSDITDPTCPASAGEAAQEQAAPATELSTPGASLENFSVAEPENALPRATLETLPETIAGVLAEEDAFYDAPDGGTTTR